MTMSPSEDAALRRRVAFLRDPKTHGLSERDMAGPIETHGAVVVLAGERAYKLKKPVAFPYMNFSTRARRRQVCRHELEINRRTAPDLYLGVAGLVDVNGTLTLIADAQSDSKAEPVLVMRRFDESLTLDRVCEQGPLPDALCEALGREIAALQARCTRHRAIPGRERVASVLEINARALRASSGPVFEPDAVEDLISRSQAEADRIAATLDLRSRTGRVVRGHGDLHTGNIFLDSQADNRPVLFDAIEFDEALAIVDVAYDIAFLIMDLLHRDQRDAACRLWNAWLEASDGGKRPDRSSRRRSGRGDDGAAATLPLFLSMRAAVRAHVGATKALQNPDAPELWVEPRSYLAEARGFLAPSVPHVLCISGLSGTGKSTLARAVAPHLGAAPGATILRSDAIRKRMAGVAPETRLPPERYTREMSARVYATLTRRARIHAEAGRVVIADAVYAHPDERRHIENAARRAGAGFTGIWLDLPVEAAKARVAGRTHDVSDATAEVVARQAAFANPPEHWLRLDASQPIERLARRVRDAVTG
jgi:hypothetical protein